MAYDTLLAERIRPLVARRRGFAEKKMFGGIGFLLNGNMCVGIWKDSLIVRLGPEQGADALEEPFVREFDITGRPMKGWAMVGPKGIAEDDELRAWIERAAKFVGKLPRK